MRLSTKFQGVIFAVVVLAVASSSAALVSAWQIAGMMRQATAEYLPAIRAAEEVEIALLEQRELAGFFLKDGNHAWLDKLRGRKEEFQQWLSEARLTTHDSRRLSVLEQLEKVYGQYDQARSEAIALAATNPAEAGRMLDRQVRTLGDQAYDLCERYIDDNTAFIDGATAGAQRQMAHVTLGVTVCSLLTIAMATVLLLLFFRGVLVPLRRMVAEARQFTGGEGLAPFSLPADELPAMGVYLGALMSNVADARTALEESRQRVMAAEKLASVGKLAASVAHEIRNPLTSMKMWLFSLRKRSGGDPGASRKLGIIAEEVERLESIVHHFLEFARPPQLKPRAMQLGPLVDGVVELVHDRAAANEVKLTGPAQAELPPAMVDAEQLRQVLLNLVGNALEATAAGGQVALSIDPDTAGDGREMLVLRVCDTGAGMSDEVRRRLFEPFFTTKEQGTGLGLCIAARIMAEHNGRLVVETTSPQGTTFALWIPVAREPQS